MPTSACRRRWPMRSRRSCSVGRRRAGYRVPRVTFHLGRWIRSTDWYPDYQLRFYDRRRARWTGRLVHESVKADGAVTDSAGRVAALRLPRPRASFSDHGPLYVAGRAADVRGWPARRLVRSGCSSAGSVSPQLPAPRRLSRRDSWVDRVRDECAVRRPQVRKTLGTVFALHIDTARSWRGGQQQVLLTVLGLRARGHRAVLVAHPEGELYRRASEGPDLVPLAPMNEVDLAAAWKLSRIIRQWKPAIVHAHDPHAVAMTALGLSFGAPVPRPKVVASRRVDFHLQGNAFSQWKYRQVDGFIAASGAIRDILVADGIPAGRAWSWCTTGSMSGRSRIGRRRISMPSTGCRAARPVIVNVGALVGAQGPEASDRRHADRVARGARRAPGDLRRGRVAGGARTADQAPGAGEATCSCPASARTCCR